MAQAPSEVGQDSSRRTGSQTMGESRTVSRVMSGSFRWAKGFLSAFLRSFTATIHPMYSGACDRAM